MYSLLQGVRVVDVSRLIPGAYATAKLADLGADVIKVELPPRGDYMRSQPPQKDGLSILYQALNRNKRSIELDLASSRGRAGFEKLIRTTDIFVEGALPGGMARLGADSLSISLLKPDIIYCSITGYGQTGPYRMLPSHGANLEASAGLVLIEERSDGTAEPTNIRIFNSSQSGAMHAALAVVAALERRRRTGQGALLDIAGWDGAISWQYADLTCRANLGIPFPGSEGFGARYGAYRAKDGRWVMFAAIEPKLWIRFCGVVRRPDLAGWVDQSADTDYGSLSEGELRAELAQLIASRTQKEWTELAVQHQLPLAPVIHPQELLDDKNLTAREMLVETVHPLTGGAIRLIAIPIKVDGESFEIIRPAPLYGQHTDEILDDLPATDETDR